MRSSKFILIAFPLLILGATVPFEEWKEQKQKGYALFYKGDDESEIKRYADLVNKGMRSVAFFTKDSYKKEFSVYIHPNRAALDKQWQSDWSMPEFRSECWMVAGGIAGKLDLLSPLKWKNEACEHDYTDKDKTQKVITHELFHIYHAQNNPSSDFSETQGIDWFVEGFATYASGQCDTERLTEIKKAVADKRAPTALDDFWKGKMKYGLSGSMAMYIDKKYGRDKLKELLKFKIKSEVLGSLKTDEQDLLKGWADYIVKM